MTSTEYTQISVETDGGVAVVTLDRPDRLNAFTVVMGRELARLFADLDADDTVGSWWSPARRPSAARPPTWRGRGHRSTRTRRTGPGARTWARSAACRGTPAG